MGYRLISGFAWGTGLAALMVILVLSGCGNNENQPGTTVDPESETIGTEPPASGSPGNDDIPELAITVEKTIDSQIITDTYYCLKDDNSINARVVLFPASVHPEPAQSATQLSDNTVDEAIIIPVEYTENGEYRYSLTFSKIEYYTAVLVCEPPSSSDLSISQNLPTVMLNIFVMGNEGNLTVDELALPERHLTPNTLCSDCHWSNAKLLVSILDYQHPGIDRCNTCHDGNYRSGKPESHVATTDSCGNCHSTDNWLIEHVNSNDKPCVECHNGENAMGKTDNHISSSEHCDACHSLQRWIPLKNMDHNQVAGSCVSCHEMCLGSGSSFCGANHIFAISGCDLCHSTSAWKPPLIDHAELVAPCVDCHNGSDASGKSPNHINTTDNCRACHEPAPSLWTPVPPVNVNHDEVIGTCAECHETCVVAITGCGEPLSHKGFENECQACHNTTSWLPVETIDHDKIITDCISCHDGVTAMGKNANHVLSSDDCIACHNKVAWLPSNFDHEFAEGTCVSCHDGCVPINCLHDMTNHIAVGGDCVHCHNYDSWIPAHSVDHAFVVGTCSDCHDGDKAVGKPTDHISTTNECDTCHDASGWLTGV